MAHVTTGSVFRQMASLYDGGSVAGLSDRQLIDRFVASHDAAGEAAFAALVIRHGPMVMHVCGQVLGDLHHAEDAFQAVFLVLARRAPSIRDPDLLSNWLYGVALRSAGKAKARLVRQRRNERREAMIAANRRMDLPADRRAIDREQAEVLHHEIERLPNAFRLPVILCYFEGLPLEEAARRLRWPEGTLRSRLARARAKLRRGLTRRGVSLSVAALGAAPGSRSASASISSHLCHETTRAAMSFAAGQAGAGTGAVSATALAQEVLRSILIGKLRLTVVTLFVMAACAGYFARSLSGQDEPGRQPDATRPRAAAATDGTTQPSAPGRMSVVGYVLDPQGKPVPNAVTMVYAAIKQPGSGPIHEKMRPSAIGQARTDGSGRFQVDAPRTSSSRHHRMGAVALAPGYGAGWIELDPDTERAVVDISLRPEQVIQGRLLDLIGRPVQGVEVVVQGMGRVIPGNPGTDRGESIEGPWFGWNRRSGLTAWPKPAISDAEGRFAVRGAGRDLRVTLVIDDPRFARFSVPIKTDRTSDSKPVTLALEQAKIIRGRITDAETGTPIPYAQIVIMSYKGSGGIFNEFEADAQGQFRVNPLSADRYEISVKSPEGHPYLTVSKSFNWPKGAVEHPIDLALPRGVVIRGKATEEGTGKPVAGARINFGARRTADRQPSALNGQAESGRDGSFQLAVLPSPGYLIALAPSDDYMLREISDGMVFQGKPGGRRFYVHAFLACDPKPAGQSLDVNLEFRRGVTVNGRVIGPEGQPIQNALMISRVLLAPYPGAWLRWHSRFQSHGSAASGQFEIHGLDPDAKVPVYFLDPQHKLGATVNFSGKSADRGPVTVRLDPCGTAKARLIDAGGNPIAAHRGSGLISMVVTPGRFPSRQLANEADLAADQGNLALIDPVNYANGPLSDPRGQIAFPALIPGATYRLAIPGTTGTQPDKVFTVKPGETFDLGDILIEHPAQ
jgi:RNA polymerase sigma factor (sigma-70 family)